MAMQQVVYKRANRINTIWFLCTICSLTHEVHPKNGICGRCGEK